MSSTVYASLHIVQAFIPPRTTMPLLTPTIRSGWITPFLVLPPSQTRGLPRFPKEPWPPPAWVSRVKLVRQRNCTNSVTSLVETLKIIIGQEWLETDWHPEPFQSSRLPTGDQVSFFNFQSRTTEKCFVKLPKNNLGLRANLPVWQA